MYIIWNYNKIKCGQYFSQNVFESVYLFIKDISVSSLSVNGFAVIIEMHWKINLFLATYTLDKDY